MKIAMLIARYAPAVGGAEVQCRRLSEELVRRGHQVTVFTERFRYDLPEDETQGGVRVRRLPTVGGPPLSSFTYAFHAMRHLRRDAFDVFHAHLLSTTAALAVLASRLSGRPALLKVAGARGTGDVALSKSSLRGRLKLWWLTSQEPYWVGPSQETVSEVIAAGASPVRSQLIPNGVDLTRFAPTAGDEKTALRKKFHLPETSPVAVFAGRWVGGKGVERLLRLWEHASIVQAGWHLVLLLPVLPADRTALNEAQAALKERLHVVVATPEPSDFYRAADAAVLLSEGEGLSNFLIEAMACGLPIVCTPASMPLPAAESNRFAWTVESDQDAWTVLGGEAASQDLRGRKGEASRDAAKNHFSLEAVATAYETLYGRMIKEAER